MSSTRNRAVRRMLAPSAALIAGAALSGCVGMAPTYGTGKAADEQLMEDVTSMFSLAPKKREQIDYKPRPELVKPAPGTEVAALPAPQDNIVTASSNSAVWPESPEARRARVRAEATEKRDDPNFEPEIAMNYEKPNNSVNSRYLYRGNVEILKGTGPEKQQRADFNKRLAENKQGSATSRKYLSEPPLEYRVPAETAAVGDVGEDEWKKERRRKAGHTKKGGGWWPF